MRVALTKRLAGIIDSRESALRPLQITVTRQAERCRVLQIGGIAIASARLPRSRYSCSVSVVKRRDETSCEPRIDAQNYLQRQTQIVCSQRQKKWQPRCGSRSRCGASFVLFGLDTLTIFLLASTIDWHWRRTPAVATRSYSEMVVRHLFVVGARRAGDPLRGSERQYRQSEGDAPGAM
jgi:hypothetical protein